MKITFILLLLSHIVFAQIPISEAHTIKVGKTVTVKGNMTATFGKLSFIQDNTGGIGLYGADVSLNDSVSVTGTLDKYNGMLEIIADSINTISKDHRTIPLPLLLGNIPEHEGELIQINNITLTPPNQFFYPQWSGFIKQEDDSVQYWIDGNTDLAGYSIPNRTNIIGIVGRYGNIIQILPRSHSDIPNTTRQQLSTSNNFTIMNWNVEFFGAKRYGPSNDKLQIENVSRVINTVQPDIVALQEVSSDTAFDSLLENLPFYKGRCSKSYSYSFTPDNDFPPQKVCFIYKAKAVREKILFKKMFDENPSEMFASGRLPYLIEFDINGLRLSLVNLHAKSGASDYDLTRRLSDSQILKDSLDTYRDLILLGDFNDDVDRSIVKNQASPYSNFVQDNNYTCISKTLSENNWRSTISYNDMIDHQIISSSLSSRHISTKILNVFSIIDQYPKTTSDHLPVISEFDFNKIITGIKEQSTPIIHPNPTRGNIWFPINSDITIMNALGDIIIKEKGAHPPISFSEYAPGLYLVVLEDQIFKIIKI